jgi:hypothetical protein
MSQRVRASNRTLRLARLLGRQRIAQFSRTSSQLSALLISPCMWTGAVSAALLSALAWGRKPFVSAARPGRDSISSVLTLLGHSWDNECPFRGASRAEIPPKTGVFPMTRADSASVPIPPGSPLAIGWRADVAALLMRHGLAEMMDVISAYAELCVRQEPDTALDPLDRVESVRIELPRSGRPNCGPETVLTVARIADPAFRRIDTVAELEAAHKRTMLAATRMPLPSRIRGGSKKSLRTRRRAIVVA